VHLLDAVPIFNLLAVPGEADPSLIAALQAYCAGRRAFLIADSAVGSTFATLQNGPDSRMTGANAINAAFYFPWLNALDAQQNITRPFPPSGFVAGLYAATDASRGVWRSPAGLRANLTGQSGPVLNLTDPQVAALSARAVNCIRHIAQFGDVVWGDRTLGGGDQAGSQWKYVSVRRLALFIESSLYNGIQWAAFEPNNEQLWAQLRSSVGAFMQTLFVQGAFQGITPAQAYFVTCDARNNPQSSIDQGVVNIQVGFAPLYPAEFVVIQIRQMAGQSGGTGDSRR
jgi:Bacteriophage tail sheath protein